MVLNAKTLAKWLISTPFVVALIYVTSVLYNNERVVPRGVVTIQDFYARYGNPPHVDSFAINGRTFYRVIGEIPAPLAFPKGSPQYIFDGSGRLVDWTSAAQGDPDFQARWSDNAQQEMVVSYFLERFPPN
jgi:hypothetical protein